MNMPNPPILPISANDKDRSLATLVNAFAADPFIRWLFPDAHGYLTHFPQFLNVLAGSAFKHTTAFRTVDFGAAALWLPPGVSPDAEALGAFISECIDENVHGDVFNILEQVNAAHPQAAHWYLPAIGVDPLLQGRGYGSALLAHGLAICDRSRTAVYLEATTPANIPLYERFGFEIVGSIQAGSSPMLTPMVRGAW
jgi:ribosomal protein S18 acetylase RimI-like enzyme